MSCLLSPRTCCGVLLFSQLSYSTCCSVLLCSCLFYYHVIYVLDDCIVLENMLIVLKMSKISYTVQLLTVFWNLESSKSCHHVNIG